MAAMAMATATVMAMGRSAEQRRSKQSSCRRRACALVRCLPLSSAILVHHPAVAAKWDIVPTLAFEETYTDNVALSPDATKRSDWVTVVTPGIFINADGARLKFNLNYS